MGSSTKKNGATCARILAATLSIFALIGCGGDAPPKSSPEPTGRISSALVTPFSTSLLAGSPTFIRPILVDALGNETYLGNITSFQPGYMLFKYSVQPISTPTSGNFDIEVVSGAFQDTMLFIYQGSFDPASPLSNLVVANDDQASTYLSKITSWPLTAGVSYYLVVTSYDPSSTGAVNFQGSGPAALVVAPASSLTVSGFSSSATACATGTVTVTAKDSGGSTAASYRGTVHFSSSDAQAFLPADYTFVAGDNGAHTFTVGLKTVGTQSITVADTTYGLTGSQSGITVQPASGRTVSIQSGGTQSVANGTSFAPLQVKVTDNCGGNPISGVVVTYAAPASGASATLGSMTATTNSSGLASVTASPNGTLGNYNLTATVPGGSFVTFSLTNTVGPASKVTLVSGSGQTAAPGASFASPLIAKVTDAYDNAVSGAQVTYSAPGSGASATFTGNPATSNSGGQASVTATANGTNGTYTVTASVSGGSTSASFSLTNVMPTIIIMPTSITLAPRASTTFLASGGSGTGYSFTLTSHPSGGTINATSGVYVAGSIGGTTDTVTLADSMGTMTTATVTVGPGVSVTPSAPAIAPLGSQTFVASGGSGTGYTYALTTNNSQGSIGASTGVYVAGPNAAVTDVVTVTDSLGNTATVTIAVGSGVAVTPMTTTVAPRGNQTLVASGGSGSGYSFALSNNRSNGSITPAGVYTAGNTGNVTDVVAVTDSLGNTGLATITVGPGVSITGGASTSPPRGALNFGASGGSATGYAFTFTTNGSGGTISTAGHYVAGATGNTTDVIKVTDSLGNVSTTSVTVGAAVSLSPSAPHVAPRGTTTLTASGGSGTGFTFALTTNVSGGSIGASSGTYTAGASANAIDVVTVTDSLGNTDTVSVSVGSALAVTPASATVSPKGSVTVLPSGGSGSGYTFALTTNGSGGTVDPTTGRYVAGAVGSTTDVVTTTDSLHNTATTTLTVGPGVTLTPATTTVAPLGQVALIVSGGSGTGYTFSLTTNGSSGSVDASSGRYAAGALGSTADIVTVTDSLGNTSTSTITVSAVMAAAASSLTSAPGEGHALAVSGGAGQAVFGLTSNGSGGTVDATTGAYVAGHNPDSTDVVTVTDANGATVLISVSVGHGISITPPAPGVAPRQNLTFTAEGGSGAGYAFALSTNASGGTIDPTTGAYTAGTTAAVVDVVTVTDSFQNTASVSVSVGNALSLNPFMVSLPPRQTFPFTATGGTGTGYQYSLTTNGSGATLDATTGAYQAGSTPNSKDVLKVVDSVGNMATASVFVGTGLVLTPSTLQVAPRSSTTLIAKGGSGSGYTFTLMTNASGGTVQNTSGVYRAGPTPGATDVVVATDSLGNTATATITVGAGVTLSAASTTTPPLGHLTFVAAGGGGGDYQYQLRQNGSGGTIDGSSGEYTAGDLPGTVDTIVATDALGNSASVDIAVGAGVSALATPRTVAPGGVSTLTATGGSGMGYTFTMRTNSSGASVNKKGSYTAGSIGGVQDIVRVTDSLGNHDDVVIVVGDAVGIDPPTASVSPGGHVTFTAFGGQGTYTFSLTTNASGGVIDAATGSYTAGKVANVTDVVKVADGLGKETTATIDVGDGVSLTPKGRAIAPRGTIAFTVTGGAGSGYLFTLATNASGGTIDMATGLYTAGQTGNVTDLVAVTDALGNTDVAPVMIGAGLVSTVTVGTVTPHGTTVITVSGGTGTYAYSFLTNGSGASLNAVTGAYTAGMMGDSNDVIDIVDENGAHTTVTIHIGPSLALTPGSPASVATGKSLAFVASGGSGTGYTFKLLSSPSGGTVNATTGVYTAGKVPGTDALQVRDSLDNVSQVSIQVTSATGGGKATGGGSGCSCDSTAGSPAGTPWSLIALAVAALLTRRRPARR